MDIKEQQKKIAAYRAAEYVKDGMVLGLGTGSTVFYLVEAVGELVKKGMKIQAISTSIRTEELAKSLGIELLTPEQITHIDLAIDGVDEIDPAFRAVKGGGGALMREKVIACWSKEVIWIMDEGKPVEKLGAFPLPVEVMPYGLYYVKQYIEKNLGYKAVLRDKDGKTYVTDNGNYILDLHVDAPDGYPKVMEALPACPGVAEVGIFDNTCNRIVIGKADGTTEVRENPNKK